VVGLASRMGLGLAPPMGVGLARSVVGLASPVGVGLGLVPLASVGSPLPLVVVTSAMPRGARRAPRLYLSAVSERTNGLCLA
jgi:hypothetical protein